MEYKDRYPGLMHFNKDELLSRINYDEKNAVLLLNSYFREFQGSVRQIRAGIEKSDRNKIRKHAILISKAAEAVCFDIMVQLAKEVNDVADSDNQKVFELLEEMEIENETLREIVEDQVLYSIR